MSFFEESYEKFKAAKAAFISDPSDSNLHALVHHAITLGAFLPSNEFTDGDSLMRTRPLFSPFCKIGMLVGLEGVPGLEYLKNDPCSENDVIGLDSVDDFVAFILTRKSHE